MRLRSYFLLATLACSCCAYADDRAWSTQAQAASPTTRALSLTDLGITDVVTLSDAGDNRERHFFIPIPQQARLKDVRIDLRAVFLRPFTDEAVLSFMVDGVAVSKLSLSGSEEGFSRPVRGDEKVVKTIEGTRAAKEIVLSIPLHDLSRKKGYIDLVVAFSSRASRDASSRAARNTLSIDPKATGLVYTFDADSVADVRTLLDTLPHRPLILLPQGVLTPTQYEAALRTALALSQKDMQPEFIAIPRMGDTVATQDLNVPDALKALPGFAEFAASHRAALTISRPEQIGAWLVLRSMSARGLAQIVIDSAQAGKALHEALATLANPALEKQFNAWALPAPNPKANVRVAALAGQPVLLLDEPNMLGGAALLASAWLDIAASREAMLDKAVLFTNDEQDKTHFYFPQSQSVKDVEKKAEWIVPFKLADLPQGKWPDAFEINLLAAPTGDRVRSVASVYLNDNLLVSDFMRSDGQFERLTARIPQYSIAASNYLKVEVRRRCESDECGETMQGYPVQMLPSSYLDLGERKDAQQFFMLPPVLAHESDVVLPGKYLKNAAQSLPFVHSILSGLSVRTRGMNLVFTDKTVYAPSRTYVSFEVAPASESGWVKGSNGQLAIRNAQGKVVFDGSGLGSALATVQLLHSGGSTGVMVAPVGEALPQFAEPLDIAQGDLAILDEQGVKLSLNLADPKNELQFEQQNSDVGFFISRNRGWFIGFGVMVFLVAGLFGLRRYFQRGTNRELK